MFKVGLLSLINIAFHKSNIPTFLCIISFFFFLIIFNYTYQELEALQSGLQKKASLSSSDAEFIGLQVRE